MGDVLSIATSLIAGSIRVSIPIAFAALGGTLSERSGIINMGLEGTMLMGAFFGVVGSYYSQNVWIGLLVAMLAGALVGLLHGVLTIKFKCEHVLAGVGINVLASGLTVVLLQMIFNAKGKSCEVPSFNMITIPGINQIPVLKDIIGQVSPMLILLVISIVGVWFLLYRTVFGLRARVIGENPEAAGSMGINVYRTQYICVILCGILAAMGGAYMSIGDIHLFSRDMVAGRGFIAMAVVIFGGWHPVGAYLGSLLFGLAQSMQYRLQSGSIPPQLVQMLPYVMTLVVLEAPSIALLPQKADIITQRENNNMENNQNQSSLLTAPRLEEVRKILREKVIITPQISEEMSQTVRRQEALVDSMLRAYTMYDNGIPIRPTQRTMWSTTMWCWASTETSTT